MATPTDPDPIARLRAERDLYRRLLELGLHDEIEALLEEALELIQRVTGAARGYLEVRHAGEGRPPVRLARGFTEADLGRVRGEISSGIVAKAIATGRTISTASAASDPRFRDHASVAAGRIQAVVCAPIGRGAPFGVVYLQGRDETGPFPEEDRAVVELFAERLAPLADRLLARGAAGDAEAGFDATREQRAKLPGGAASLVGSSRAMADLLAQIHVAAPVHIALLVTGETGTGKTALARVVHEASPRAAGPFVEINCASLPEALVESELFGAEKGAHSTASKRIEGKIEAAAGGTLFLDEIAELPLASQAKLLTFLQSRRYYRLGGNAPLVADVRVIAATNADLGALVAQKKFREDLFYRLDVLTVRAPPLRERPGDVPRIAEAVLGALAASHGVAMPPPLTRGARAILAGSEWPGNVRQLENVVQRGFAVALAQGAQAIDAAHLFPERAPATAVTAAATPPASAPAPAHVHAHDDLTFQDATRAFQRGYVLAQLEATSWNVSAAARRAGVSRSHLNDLIRAFGLARPEGA